MSSTDDISDEWVADLLSQEAADCALKYSTLGMDAYKKPAARPASHPKPNTRFLSNIVKATNNHNRNLLEQERADSQARLNNLERTKHEAERRRRPGAADTRKRMLGDIKAIIGGSSKKRKPDDSDHAKEEAEGDSKRLRKDGGDFRIRGRSHKRDEETNTEDLTSNDRNSRKELFADHGPKRGMPRNHRDKERARSREEKHRNDRRDDRKDRIIDGAKDRSHRRTKKDRATEETRLAEQHSHNSDSDPLDDIIGPKPPSPVRRRGRGTVSGSSAMDNRFESGYDPKGDVALDQDEDDDDWGSALEALRDRQLWKDQGADRLRAAGFTDEQVKKWEKGDQKNDEDVRWTKKGEQREWDRGKTLKNGI